MTVRPWGSSVSCRYLSGSTGGVKESAGRVRATAVTAHCIGTSRVEKYFRPAGGDVPRAVMRFMATRCKGDGRAKRNGGANLHDASPISLSSAMSPESSSSNSSVRWCSPLHGTQSARSALRKPPTLFNTGPSCVETRLCGTGLSSCSIPTTLSVTIRYRRKTHPGFAQ